MILSVAQFRPEKAHLLQLKAFHRYCQLQKSEKSLKLVFIGSVRNLQDQSIVEGLQEKIREFQLEVSPLTFFRVYIIQRDRSK
jgi:alpha-1,2-mannosyltransferase